MDATQKRRMWKVAIAHFILTVFFGFVFVSQGWVFSGTREKYLWVEAWRNLKLDAFLILQPQFWFLNTTWEFQTAKNILSAIPFWVRIPVFLISIPLWSICFGWLFVKLGNWLNHLPVLGKKVF
jgi:hypothetical protein